jgi:hypothetical protein
MDSNLRFPDRSAPAREQSASHDGLTVSRPGTEISNPSPSSGQSANHRSLGCRDRRETRDIHRAGGRYVTLVGSNPLFHLPQDRWPYAVDTDVMTRVAAAAAALVVKLTR